MVRNSLEYVMMQRYATKEDSVISVYHIEEGLEYLAEKCLQIEALQAYCLQFLRDDSSLISFYKDISAQGASVPRSLVIFLAMEFRKHSEFSLHQYCSGQSLTASPLHVVNSMTAALLVQNYRHFLRHVYKQGKYAKDETMNSYYKHCLDVLDVNYRVVCIEDETSPFYVLEVK